MKKLSLLIFFLTTVIIVSGQVNPVDELYDKYAGRDGFTSVLISSKMLGLFANMESGDKAADDIMGKLKSIRILAVEDTTLNRSINFYTELARKMDFSGYEEIMVVREGRNVTYFLTKLSGKSISELLLISGGTGGNTLISIRGDLNLKELSELSRNMGIEQLKALEDLEKKLP